MVKCSVKEIILQSFFFLYGWIVVAFLIWKLSDLKARSADELRKI